MEKKQHENVGAPKKSGRRVFWARGRDARQAVSTSPAVLTCCEHSSPRCQDPEPALFPCCSAHTLLSMFFRVTDFSD